VKNGFNNIRLLFLCAWQAGTLLRNILGQHGRKVSDGRSVYSVRKSFPSQGVVISVLLFCICVFCVCPFAFYNDL
jgi:hypothetical protein